MEDVSKEIMSTVASEEQIQNYLAVYHPEILLSLEEAPDFATALFQITSDKDGWETVGKKLRGSTLWHFWKMGEDINQILSLDRSASQAAAPQHVNTQNRFEVFAREEKKEEDKDRRRKTSEKDIAKDEFSFLFEVSDTGDDTSSESEEAEEQVDIVEDSPASRLSWSRTDALSDKTAFLKYFGYQTLPQVAKTDRNLEALYAEPDLWSFSFEERRRLAADVETKAKRELDSTALDVFESLARKHAEVRLRYSETQDNVSEQFKMS